MFGFELQICACKYITCMSAYLCELKKGDSAEVGSRKSWEMDGIERNAWSKVETDSKEQIVAASEGEHGSKENCGGGCYGYFSAQPW